MKKVFIYVGHSNWGKSMALKVLTGNNSHQQTVQIGKYNVRVRKMSNDDSGEGLFDWVKKISQLNYDRFVIAFCPKVPPANGNATLEQDTALKILNTLSPPNELYFFVQEEQYSSCGTDRITQIEINWLQNFGTVFILKGQNTDVQRADEFQKFIIQHI